MGRMELEAFRERVAEMRRPTGHTQAELAAALALDRFALSHKLHGRGRLTHAEVKGIVTTLAAWQGIATRAEAGELLALAGLRPAIFSAEEWRRPPLGTLPPGLPREAPHTRPTRAAGAERRSGDAQGLEAPAEVLPSARGGGFQRPLPLPPSPLVGRSREVQAVGELLAGGARLVTLTGPGGVGKTRLALELAIRLEGEGAYPGGVVFVDLAPLDDPDHVPWTIAAAVGVREPSGQRLLQRLSAALRHEHLLLVLDNWEHLLPPARLVGTLLAGAPRLTVLATSRAPLRLSAEQEFRVPPLGLPAPGSTSVEAVLASEAGQLFVRRARASRAGFDLDGEDAGAVAALCRRLDGLPLALELAASRVRTFAPRQLAARAGDLLPLLSDGPRDLPARQQTLSATLDWSHALLQTPEQRLFARLAVFAGGCTLEAAEAVGGPGLQSPGGCLVVLDRLVGHGLLESDRSDRLGRGPRLAPLPKSVAHLHPSQGHSLRSLDPGGGPGLPRLGRGPRFGMLETVREYARLRLARSGEEAEIRDRHASYYLAWARAPAAGGRHPVARLERERDNLRAALGWLVETGQAEAGFRLAELQFGMWYGHGPRQEARTWLARLLALPAAQHPPLRAELQEYSAWFARASGDLQAAREICAEALETARARGEGAREARLLWGLGTLALEEGHPSAAREWFERSVARARDSGGPREVSVALIRLGDAHRILGNIAGARRCYEESLVAGHNPPWSRRNLGFVALAEGDSAGAEALFRQSLEEYRRDWEAHAQTCAICLVGLGAVAAARHDLSRAARILGAVEALLDAVGEAVDPAERGDLEALRRVVRRGNGPAAARARAAGRALSLDAAVTFALTPSDNSRPQR